MKYLENTVGCRSVITALLVFVGIALSACQSRPSPEIHYYLLQATNHEVGRGIVEIAEVKMPAYLQTANLMMAVSDLEIRPAQYHLWSEPLQEGVRRVLEAELVGQLKYVDKDVLPIRIDLEVELFHVTQSGDVLLKGAWRLQGEDGQGHLFSIKTGLEGNGYAEAARGHVRALELLAKAIAADL